MALWPAVVELPCVSTAAFARSVGYAPWHFIDLQIVAAEDILPQRFIEWLEF